MATKDRTSLKNDFANGKYATGEKFADLIDSMKVVQLPVVDPQALGTSLSFIDSISQDADGKITATKKTLDLSNAHELNPFKGWYKTGDTLPTDGFDGAYLYFKDTSELTGQTTIYRWNGTTYADTGTVVDTSNVQTFASGQQVNAVKIKDENGEEVTGLADVLSAEAGERMNSRLYGGNYSETNIISLNTLNVGYYNTNTTEGAEYLPSATQVATKWKCIKVELEVGQSCKAIHAGGSSNVARNYVVTNENNIVQSIGPNSSGIIVTEEFIATSETGKLNVYLNFYDENNLFEGQSLEKTTTTTVGGDINEINGKINEINEELSSDTEQLESIGEIIGYPEHDVVYSGTDGLSNMYVLAPNVSMEVIQGTSRWKSYIVPVKPNTEYKFNYNPSGVILIVTFSEEPVIGSIGLRYWSTPDTIVTSNTEHFLLIRQDGNNPKEITVTYPASGLVNDFKNLTGYKNILCLGDSITEFADNYGARYSDYLAKLTGGEVVNGGFGGSTFRQHAALDEYGGMDIVNVVKALCSGTFPSTPQAGIMQYQGSSEVRTLENVSSVSEATKTSFETTHYANYTKLSITYTVNEVSITATIMVSSYSLDGTTLTYTSDYELMTTTNEWKVVINAAEIVALASNDNNRPVVKRLEETNLEELEAITIFAGTNDWNVNGDVPGSESTIGTSGVEDTETTLGAIDIIIRLLSTTYPNIRLYWFTPIVRYVGAPEFKNDYSYVAGECCKRTLVINNAKVVKTYKFVHDHSGAWDDNDVIEITAGLEERTPQMWSDTVLRRGVTLKQFSALIENEVELFHIPVCDLYNTLGWNTYNFSNFFNDNDGTHPRKGMKYLAEKIYKFLQSH